MHYFGADLRECEGEGVLYARGMAEGRVVWLCMAVGVCMQNGLLMNAQSIVFSSADGRPKAAAMSRQEVRFCGKREAERVRPILRCKHSGRELITRRKAM